MNNQRQTVTPSRQHPSPRDRSVTTPRSPARCSSGPSAARGFFRLGVRGKWRLDVHVASAFHSQPAAPDGSAVGVCDEGVKNPSAEEVGINLVPSANTAAKSRNESNAAAPPSANTAAKGRNASSAAVVPSAYTAAEGRDASSVAAPQTAG